MPSNSSVFWLSPLKAKAAFFKKRKKMIIRYQFFLCLIACVAACNADSPAEPKKSRIENSVFINYVPTGWLLQNGRILDIDINGDGTNDAILTLIEDERQQKGDISNPIIDERALLVLLGDKDGKYRRLSLAKNVLLCGSCAGMRTSSDDVEPGGILYSNNILTIDWFVAPGDSVLVKLHFGFDKKLKQFVLLSDEVEKMYRYTGKSTITRRDFVVGIKNVDGKVSAIDKQAIPMEMVKYSNYLGKDHSDLF